MTHKNLAVTPQPYTPLFYSQMSRKHPRMLTYIHTHTHTHTHTYALFRWSMTQKNIQDVLNVAKCFVLIYDEQ